MLLTYLILYSRYSSNFKGFDQLLMVFIENKELNEVTIISLLVRSSLIWVCSVCHGVLARQATSVQISELLL